MKERREIGCVRGVGGKKTRESLAVGEEGLCVCVCAAVLSRFLRLVPAIDYRHHANPQRKSVPSVIPIMMHSSLEGETSLGVVCVLLLGVRVYVCVRVRV